MNISNDHVIIYGLEAIIRTFLKHKEPRERFQEWLLTWTKWEQMHTRSKLTLIGTDIGKGIVPIEQEARCYRDLVGWCYQDVAKQAKRVDVIWYGLNEQLK